MNDIARKRGLKSWTGLAKALEPKNVSKQGNTETETRNSHLEQQNNREHGLCIGRQLDSGGIFDITK